MASLPYGLLCSKKNSSLASLSILLNVHYQFIFHTLFQCNDRAQDVSLISHKNAFFQVKVQIVKKKDIICIFQSFLKRVPKN